jgi:hypothetical protein
LNQMEGIGRLDDLIELADKWMIHLFHKRNFADKSRPSVVIFKTE